MARDDKTQPGTDASPFSFGPSAASVPGQADSVAGGSGRKGDPFGARSADAGADVSAGSLFGAPGSDVDDPGVAIGYRKSLFGHRNEVSVYTAQMDARHAMDSRKKAIAISVVALIVMIPLVLILPTGLYGDDGLITPARWIEYFGTNVTGLANWITGGPTVTAVSVLFWQVLGVAVAGAALAVNGCVFQGALRNALAAPSTLGVVSGGTLGTLVFTLMFGIPGSSTEVIAMKASELEEQLAAMDPLEYLFAVSGRALFSIAGCFAIVALVLVIAHIAGRGKVSKVALLIAGQVFAALVAGVISVIRTYIMVHGSIEEQIALTEVVGGSMANITSPFTLALMAVPVLIGLAIIMTLRFRLNLLAFHEDDARSMGISTTFTRNAVIIVCTVLTGVVISFVGSVGFVGFLVPHLARKVVGPDFRYLVPASALFGAVFLLLAYHLMNATAIFSGSLGTLTTIVGAVSFLVIVIRERARGNVDWI